jgi:hypothetical protein
VGWVAVRNVFVDEAGNLDFSPSGSRFFILTSVTMDHCAMGNDLLQLRRDLTRQGWDLSRGFHATEDKQRVRDAVFRLINEHDFRVDATIFEKAKTAPNVRANSIAFYKRAWFFHLKHVLPQIASRNDELLIIGASISLNWKQQNAQEAIAEGVDASAQTILFTTASWAASSEPCLQIADYCCWALQRKWERKDERSYRLIEHKIRSEFDIFRGQPRLY